MTTESPTREVLIAEMSAQLTKLFSVAPEKITADAKLHDDLDLDSIDMIDLLSTVSEKYNMDLSPFDFEGVVTLGDFVMRFEELEKKRTANG